MEGTFSEQTFRQVVDKGWHFSSTVRCPETKDKRSSTAGPSGCVRRQVAPYFCVGGTLTLGRHCFGGRFRGSRENSMTKLILTGAVFCAFAFAPISSVNAMPVTPLSAISQIDNNSILVKGGHGRGHMGRGNRGKHLGWTRGRHRGWR